jgi:hypothetical protein
MRALLALSAFAFSLTLHAADASAAIRALDRLGKTHEWNYRVVETGSRRIITRHDASQPEGKRWSIERIDDRAPTEQEQAEFQAAWAKAGKQPGFFTQIDRATLTAVDGDTRRWRFKLKPGALDEVDSDKLDGLLTLTADGELQAMELTARKPFRVMLVAKIEQARFRVEFAKVEGVVLPAATNMEIRGSVAGMRDINQTQQRRYLDFQRRTG